MAASVASLTACSSSMTPHYYTLTPKVTPIPSSNVRVIEVLPVNLPDRLNRAPLVLSTEQGQSKILDNERWTSPLAAELRDGLSSGLQQKLGAVDRYNSGMTGGKVAYRIATDFSRFDIVQSSYSNTHQVEVVVSWIVKRISPMQSESSSVNQSLGLNHQLSCRMSFNEPIKGLDQVSNAVEASRQSLNRIVNTIANSVIAAESGTINVQGAVCS
nr:PqiC family protein [Acinetobacter ihumii]